MRWQMEPLTAWPWPRTDRPIAGRFRASWSDTWLHLEHEIDQLGARGPVVLRAWCQPGDIRRDGMLRANARVTGHGVVISFESRHGPLTYPCDTYTRAVAMPGWQANLRAIALSLEALRAVDRHGVAGHGEQYTGWRAITAGPAALFPDAEAARRWLLELSGHSLAARAADTRSLLRIAAPLAHPDRHGGDRTLWDRYDAARQLLERS